MMVTRQVLGIDIGGTYTKLGLVDEKGNISQFKKIATKTENGNLQAFLDQLIADSRFLLDHAGFVPMGIGLSLLGWLNDERTFTLFAMNSPSLNGFNIKALFEHEFNLPVILNEDLVAHNLAEYYWGSERGCDRLLTLAMGTGVGASMMVKGEPLKFTGGSAGDTGHIILRPDGPSCPEGCYGCAESLIGTANIERLALKKYGCAVNASEVIRRTQEQSDSIATEIIQEIGMYTGELLASLTPIFLPSRICLTGGTAKSGQVLLNATKTRFEELSGRYQRNCIAYSCGYFTGVEIVLSQLTGETGLLGSTVEFFLNRL
jgi:glucokinase